MSPQHDLLIYEVFDFIQYITEAKKSLVYTFIFSNNIQVMQLQILASEAMGRVKD